MSLVPVTSHPRFDAASASFQAALPALVPATRFPTSIPTEVNMRRAQDSLRAGIELLQPMTEPSDLWLHQPANAAIAAAKQAVELLAGPIQAVASGAVSPSTGSAETAAIIKDVRELIARADAATALD
jgi:hypothetical protein